MDFVQVIILSIVEGITEFLPISSTGHLILTSHLLHLPQTDFLKSFEISIQLGAILSILAIYWKTLIKNKTIWIKILAAFIPTAILGFLFYKIIKEYLLGNAEVTVLALFLGGIALIVFEKIHKEQKHHLEKIEDLNLKQAFLIGLFQSISMIPGVSRAAATIMGGLFLGLKRNVAVEFSFLLAIPTMFSATVLDLYKSELQFSSNEFLLLALGFVASFITAYFTVKFFLKFIQNHNFIPFGIYRIVLAIIFWIFILK